MQTQLLGVSEQIQSWNADPFCDIYLIRHGISEGNKAFQTTDNPAQIAYSKSILDCPLHKTGFHQSQSLQETISQIDIQVVYVSPLRRTIQTAVEIFKTHPKQKHIQFIILPLIVQRLGEADDIPYKTLQTIKEEFSSFTDGLNLDFSILETQFQIPELWRYYLLDNKELLVKLQKAVEQNRESSEEPKQDLEEQVVDIVLSEMKNLYPDTLQDLPKLFKRANEAKALLRSLIEQQNLLGQGQTVLIGHNYFIRCFTSTGFVNDGTKFSDYQNTVNLKNCEVHSYQFPNN